jgi:predicted pyridoxine 5'-phosphate oxidase superfamily flavin-nucleotide-binding protein
MTTTDVLVDKLSPAAVAALSGATTPKFLATRDAQGIPNVVPVISLEAADEHTIIFGEMMIWKTRRNLEADARVSILVLSADLRGWTVRGRFVEFQRGGAYFDHIMESESIRYNAYSGIRSAGVIQVLDVARTFKLSQARLLLDTARSRWLARRLSRDGADEGAMPPQVQEKFDRLRAAKVAAYLDASGHPDCLPALPLVPAGPARLVWGGSAPEDAADLTPGSAVAAAVITQEPVAYQVKGELAGWRRSLGRRLGVIDVREAYSASPPLPGKRLPAAGQHADCDASQRRTQVCPHCDSLNASKTGWKSALSSGARFSTIISFSSKVMKEKPLRRIV